MKKMIPDEYGVHFFFTFYAWFSVDMHQIHKNHQKARIDIAVDWIDELVCRFFAGEAPAPPKKNSRIAPDSEPKLISQLAPLSFQESSKDWKVLRNWKL